MKLTLTYFEGLFSKNEVRENCYWHCHLTAMIRHLGNSKQHGGSSGILVTNSHS